VRILKEIAERRPTVDSPKWKVNERELNAETPSARRSEEGMGTDLEVRAGGRARLAAIMRNYSTIVTECQ